jgi:glycosyltransferase involved in cell wall biosynthesis
VSELVWLPGTRDDVPELMRCFTLLLLSSINEGISNTILEAMATGLPVIATQVGGNPELVVDGTTGRLIPSQNPQAMAAAMAEYLDNPERIRQHGARGRDRCERLFSLERMVRDYLAVYDACLSHKNNNTNVTI